MSDLDELQNSLAEELARIADAAASERISPDVLFNAVARTLSRAHIQAAIAGRQAVEQAPIPGAVSGVMDFIAPLRGGASDRLASELRYMANFVSEISAEGLSPAQIKMRFSMYADHLQHTFWGAQTDTQTNAGMTEEMRELGGDDHCDDCLDMAGHWEPIGTLPEPGENSQCQARCNCRKIYQ